MGTIVNGRIESSHGSRLGCFVWRYAVARDPWQLTFLRLTSFAPYGDFTKRYNRMKQSVVATHRTFPSASTSTPSASSPSTVVLPASNRGPTLSTHTPLSTSSKVGDQLATFSRLSSLITLAPLYPTSALSTRKGGSVTTLIKDKSDRATVEQVLDPRTRLILFKMLNRGLVSKINGCISTGKEANVYHALAPEEGQPSLALKIYKTSILVFKDRDRYVSGEFRFKSGYARSNPRKMVRVWAEKEMRNLRRMRAAGVRVPEPIEVRENVLVMSFIGEDLWQYVDFLACRFGLVGVSCDELTMVPILELRRD